MKPLYINIYQTCSFRIINGIPGQGQRHHWWNTIGSELSAVFFLGGFSGCLLWLLLLLLLLSLSLLLFLLPFLLLFNCYYIVIIFLFVYLFIFYSDFVFFNHRDIFSWVLCMGWWDDGMMGWRDDLQIGTWEDQKSVWLYQTIGEMMEKKTWGRWKTWKTWMIQ